MKHYKITDITEWDVDRAMIEGDSSHTGENYNILLGEAEEKVEKLKEQGGAGLPFVCEAEDEDEALDKYNEAHYRDEYVKAAVADITELHKYNVTVQVDCQADVEVYAEDEDEAAEKARDMPLTMDKITDVLDSHLLYVHDEEKGTTKTFIG